MLITHTACIHLNVSILKNGYISTLNNQLLSDCKFISDSELSDGELISDGELSDSELISDCELSDCELSSCELLSDCELLSNFEHVFFSHKLVLIYVKQLTVSTW